MKIEMYKCDCCGNTIDTNRVHAGGLDLCETCNTLRLKMLQRMVADDLHVSTDDASHLMVNLGTLHRDLLMRFGTWLLQNAAMYIHPELIDQFIAAGSEQNRPPQSQP